MIQVREISDSEKEYWNRGIQQFEFSHPFNAYGWGEVRSIDGWEPTYLVAERSGEFCGGAMILSKKIPFTPFCIFYSPRSPVWDYDDDETLYKLFEKIRVLARKKRAIFLRSDPNIPETVISNRGDKLSALGFIHLEHRWNFWNAPRDVYVVDLTRANTSEDFFNLLDRDTRRCIRKAAKEGVSIEAATSVDELTIFYDIFSQFSAMRGFMARDYEYQKKLWDTYIAEEKGRLFLAKYKGEVIGGLICIMFAGKCLAMHMGTPYKYQKLQTYYAYVWESIKWAKDNGGVWYSFGSVGSTPTQEYFKSKFLPEAISLAGYYDMPFKPLFYKLSYFFEFTLFRKALPALIRLRRLYYGLKKS